MSNEVVVAPTLEELAREYQVTTKAIGAIEDQLAITEKAAFDLRESLELTRQQQVQARKNYLAAAINLPA